MNRTIRILTGGWLSTSVSHFTRGWYESAEEPVLAQGLTRAVFTLKQPSISVLSKIPRIQIEKD